VNIRTCQEGWREEAARDGRLTPLERCAQELHREFCACCRVERVRLEAITRILRGLPVYAPSPLVVGATRRRLIESASQMLD
jgi:hypothetical protein